MAMKPQPETAENRPFGGAELSPRQETAVLALAIGQTQLLAAKKAGVDPRTIRVWLSSCEAFPRRVAQLREDMTQAALGRFADALRLGAARSVVEAFCRLRETVQLSDELKALKEQLEGGDRGTSSQRSPG